MDSIRHIIYTVAAVTSSTVVLLCSCSKSEAADDGVLLSLDVNVEGYSQGTRASQVTSTDEFFAANEKLDIRVYEYVSSTGKYTLELDPPAPQTATREGSAGSYSYNMAKYYWKTSQYLNIFAIAPAGKINLKGADDTSTKGLGENKPNTIPSKDEFEFTYDISGSVNAKELPDLMLARYYGTRSNSGNTGIATMTFAHALSAVTFVTGDMIQCKVNSIAIKDIYGKADCSVNFSGDSPSFTWNNYKENSETVYTCSSSNVSMTNTIWPDSIPEKINDGQYTFMVIPQTVPDGASVLLNVTTERFPEGEDIVTSFSTDSSSGGVTLLPGRHYTFTVNFNVEGMMEINLASDDSIVDWTEDTTTYKDTEYDSARGE